MLSEIVDNSLTDKNTLHSYLDLHLRTFKMGQNPIKRSPKLGLFIPA